MAVYGDDRALIWAVLGSTSAEVLSRVMVGWYRSLKSDPELVSIIGFFMELGDWERARESLQRAYGRCGGRHRAKFSILQAAEQRMKLLHQQCRRLRPLQLAPRPA